MNAPVWHAVQELAAVWRSSAYVRDYIAGLGSGGGNSRGSVWHIGAQPFYLFRYLPTAGEFEVFVQSAGAQAWLEKSVLLGDAYTTVIEWLRSRLGGYPYPDALQLTPISPWTNFNVSMRVPWLIDFRRQQLQHKATPPTVPFLAIDPVIQLEAGTRLGQAIVSSPAAINVGTAWRSLTDADRQQLHDASAALQRVHYPQPDDITGSEDFRELAWSQTKLDTAIQRLTGRARAFTDALIHADRFLQQTAALFSHLTSLWHDPPNRQRHTNTTTRRRGRLAHYSQ